MSLDDSALIFGIIRNRTTMKLPDGYHVTGISAPSIGPGVKYYFTHPGYNWGAERIGVIPKCTLYDTYEAAEEAAKAHHMEGGLA